MDLSLARWRKSTLSGGNGGNCVEVAAVAGWDAAVANKATEDRVVVVRDSKNPEAGRLAYTLAEWDAFVAAVKTGEFDTARLIADSHAVLAN
jgi:hypothetical protein